MKWLLSYSMARKASINGWLNNEKPKISIIINGGVMSASGG